MISFEGVKELDICCSDSDIKNIISYVNRYFSDSEIFNAQYENCIKLSNYIKRNNLVIGEIEAEKLLENDRICNMFRVINLSGKLIRVVGLFNLSSLLEMYCFRNNIEYTRDSEISLYDKRNNDIDLIRLYMNDIIEYKILSYEDEYELSRRSKFGDLSARNELIEHNLRLVVSIAKNYMNCGVDFGDLIQYGNEGLITAANKFDVDMGYRFTTYATYWIKQAITRGIAFSCRNIRIPYGVHENVIKIRKVINTYIIANNGRIPSDLELSEITGLSLEKVKDARDAMDNSISLSTPYGREEKDSTLGEILPNDEESLEERFDNYYMSEYLDRLLDIASLNEREIFVLKARNGFFGRIYTLEEIGNIYGITREGVRQIEKHSLEKLRIAVNIKRTYTLFKNISRGYVLDKEILGYKI